MNSGASLKYAPNQGEALNDLAAHYFELVMDGKRERAVRLVLDAVEHGDATVEDVYIDVFQPSLYEVGRLWQTNRISVATEHYFTAVTQLVMSQLFPHIVGANRVGRTMVGCCVGSELHEVGMRMVSDFFEMGGWDTWFLGANTPDEAVLDALAQQNADMLCISVTMTFGVHLAGALVRKVRDRLGDGAPWIMVGGLPFVLNPGLARRIGADGTAPDARGAVTWADGRFGRAS